MPEAFHARFPVPRVLPTLRNQLGKLEHFSSEALSTRIPFFLNTRPHVAYSNPWPVHTKTLKRWKYDSIPHKACVILVVNDVWHHRFPKISVFVRPHVNENPAFSKISALESVFEKIGFR